MAVKLRRPVLVAGIGLTIGLGLLDALYHSLARVGESAALGAIALGAGWWWWQQQGNQQLAVSETVLPIDRVAINVARTEAETVLEQLNSELDAAEPANPTVAARLNSLQEQLVLAANSTERTDLKITILGSEGVGKTSLSQWLETHWLPSLQNQSGQNQSGQNQSGQNQSGQISIQDTAALLSGTAANAIADANAIAAALASDLVLFMATGDLTESEFQVIQTLIVAQQRLFVTCNKQDRYLPGEVNLVLQQLQHRLDGKVAPHDIVAIATQPNPTKVRQHQADTTIEEWLEHPDPNLDRLIEPLTQLVTQERRSLVLATTWRQIQSLKTEAQTALNQLRRDRALPLIEQFQWIAAATAFANPVPALDLLATAAINAQMVLDLGGLYQQVLSLSQAQTVASTMAKLMLKLGLVELSTQTIGHFLKSNAITFAAGGAVQGASAAYLTRIAGLSLIDYFQAQPSPTGATAETPLNLDDLRQKLRAVVQKSQQLISLPTLVQQALNALSPRSAATDPPAPIPLNHPNT